MGIPERIFGGQGNKKKPPTKREGTQKRQKDQKKIGKNDNPRRERVKRGGRRR